MMTLSLGPVMLLIALVKTTETVEAASQTPESEAAPVAGQESL